MSGDCGGAGVLHDRQNRMSRNRAVCMGCGKQARRPREYTGSPEAFRCPGCRETKHTSGGRAAVGRPLRSTAAE